MIKIRYEEGGDWHEVTRQQAIEYACKFVFGDKKVSRGRGFLELQYFNKKLILGINFTAAELRRYLHRKIGE